MGHTYKNYQSHFPSREAKARKVVHHVGCYVFHMLKVAVGMLHGQNSYVEPTSSSSPMPRSVDPSQFCIDELQQKISSVTYPQKPQNSIWYDIYFLCFFALMLFGMAASLGKLKIELREAEDNLVKALAEKLKIMLKHQFRFRAPSSEILLFSIPIDPGVPLHLWKWKFEKTSTHLQRMKKVSSTVKSPTLPC
ncbi:hypothetical protein H5410_030292 [Solanum commersonii]|uniref:Uncharacterized protein n=1 Tax=Solanum commersonii TaxID=4109 RepID=A0A9J5YFA5_SOLCO|nr:hypothetical protein H5410_030292 [Solanum commersonii]